MSHVTPQDPRLAAVMADHDRGPEYAVVECVGEDFACTATARLEQSAGKTDAELGEVFAALGWSVKPTLCPEHARNTRGSR